MNTPREWDAFVTFLKETYWPCLPPHERVVSRPDGVDMPDGVDADGGAGRVPDDLWQAAVVIFPNAEAWLHNSIPNLGGRTPLDVLGAGELAELQAILIEVAPFMLPDPKDVTPRDGA